MCVTVGVSVSVCLYDDDSFDDCQFVEHSDHFMGKPCSYWGSHVVESRCRSTNESTCRKRVAVEKSAWDTSPMV